MKCPPGSFPTDENHPFTPPSFVYLVKNQQMMLQSALFHPNSIVVVGASNNPAKPGGHLLQNLIHCQYAGELFVVNPNEKKVQGVDAYASVDELPKVELAILAVPARLCVEAVEILASGKGTRAFIVVSAGFAESGDEGAKLEQQLQETVDRYNASLIGPNCIGVITSGYAGVFTSPVPQLDPDGIDFVSGSGATAVFILEAGVAKGLRFASVFSVGNSVQVGVEDLLEHWDETFDEVTGSRVKLIYLEGLRDPQKFLRHARSLRQKGCRIAAIKAGVGESGSRAASSHTGALASSDIAVDALFKKAGIIRCYGREELANVAALLLAAPLRGSRLAVITHAGGPAVMLTDVLEQGGFSVPQLPDSEAKRQLKEKLFAGSSVENPIDFLATGTASQLGDIIDACENDFPEIDGMVVIFGSPGLVAVNDVYRLLAEKINQCSKPIYPVLPSVINARQAIDEFITAGQVVFTDEVEFGKALVRLNGSTIPTTEQTTRLPDELKEVYFREALTNGLLAPALTNQLLDAAGIPHVQEFTARTGEEALIAAGKLGFPLAMKVVGPIHKSDVGGVVLNVRNREQVINEYDRLIEIPGTSAVLLAEMASGIELFVGAKREPGFGYLVFCGIGGVWLEIMKDIQYCLAPVSRDEAMQMIRTLKSYPVLNGYRGKAGINIEQFAEVVCRVSALVEAVPEIEEMDLNPLLATVDSVVAVDTRIITGK